MRAESLRAVALGLMMAPAAAAALASTAEKVADPGFASHLGSLAEPGDKYKDVTKYLSVSIEKGNVNGSHSCTGQYTAINLFAVRDTVTGADSSNFGYIEFAYRLAKRRECTADELENFSSSSDSPPECCEDSTDLGGIVFFPLAGSVFKVTPTQDGNLPLAQLSFTLTLQGTKTTKGKEVALPDSKVVVDVALQCQKRIDETVTYTGERCIGSKCVSSEGSRTHDYCTDRIKEGVLTGTVDIKYLKQPPLNLADLPVGYSVLGRADIFVDAAETVA
eukprot:TRINITY_DN6567_c0_g1_i2.p2 TRINITY_DN6567_c0_g1~~TRINITY_DN6567_c0_g1_i2.p2  ORF type:complete len:313 (-),score=97.40 TRINITY_DN6567_c0_g1_i2:606-1436(-)